ncbi:glycosyltransferase family 4 protein [Pseudofrankia sp. DC12]|uniref:glycosyltransferase family 4 protein n=1 Tax=Pseudofrankia sp. DC12 TaxID=683315 RepID=UPI0012F76F68|nr:glycosyltransferase family 4 protein [Pseudofrankia sp. DC12]
MLIIGDDPTGPGGIGSVIRNIHEMTDHKASHVASYRPDASPQQKAVLFCQAAYVLLTGQPPERWLTHVHLSQRGSFVREGVLLWLAKLKGAACIVTIHGSSSIDFLASNSIFGRGVLAAADDIYCLGPLQAEQIAKVLDRAVDVLPNFVPIPPSPPLGISGHQFVFAGAVGARKGADVLAQAWEKVVAHSPASRLLVVGRDAGMAGVFIGLEGCTVLGECTHDTVIEIFRQSRAIILPSRAEGLPMALLEAGSYGRGSIATPVGETPALLADTGILVAVGDQKGLVNAIIEFLDDDVAVRFGQAAYAKVCTEFSFEQGRNIYQGLYGAYIKLADIEDKS